MKDIAAPVFERLEDLIAYAGERAGGSVVLATGCFDPLHVGHVRYLRAAKEHGGFLVVAVNDDGSTRRLKGGGRPVVPERDRAALLASLKVVDAVLLFDEGDLPRLLRELKPAVRAAGTDRAAEVISEAETLRGMGIETVIVGGPKLRSSSDVVAGLRRGSGRKDDA